MAKQLAALMVVTLLGLLGSVACQGNTAYYPTSQQAASSPSSSSSPSLVCYLPGWMINKLPLLPPCHDETPTPNNPLPDVSPPLPPSRLTVGYYDKYCPSAEDTVRKEVEKAIEGNPGIGAGLVRIFFHDCFVRGCDASVLLKNTSGSSAPTELFGLPNINSLRGMDVIDKAKVELENNPGCRGKVSCADIIAFAARDAARSLSYGAINFTMPAGRLDGRVSLKEEAERNLPGPFDTIDDLEKSFRAHGLGFNDMVALSGAHSFGVARCKFFSNRLPPNHSDMDSDFANSLNATCDRNGDEFRVAQDPVTQLALDNQYYKNVHSGKVLFTSDATLNSTDRARELVDGFAKNGTQWYQAFADAMVRLGELRDNTIGSPKPDPEIRHVCSIYN